MLNFIVINNLRLMCQHMFLKSFELNKFNFTAFMGILVPSRNISSYKLLNIFNIFVFSYINDYNKINFTSFKCAPFIAKTGL